MRGGPHHGDRLADGERRAAVVRSGPRRHRGDGRPAQRLPGDVRFVAAQHRVGEVDGGDVGEARDGDIGHLAGGAPHVQGGADPGPDVVQQPQPLPGGLGAAGDRLQFGGVAERRDAARRGARAVGEADVDDQQPVARRADGVRHDTPVGEQRGDGRLQAQFGHRPSLGVRPQAEQAPRLVVGEQQPPVGVHDQHPLTDGVQHRVVVLVHPRHLGEPQPVGLAAQAAADEDGPGGGQRQDARGAPEQGGQFRSGVALHPFDGDADRDQSGDRAVAAGDRDDGGDGDAVDTGDGAGEGALGEGVLVHAVGVSADERRDGVGVADALGAEEDDEVDAGGLADHLGARLQLRGGVPAVQGLCGAGCQGERLGDGPGAVLCVVGAGVARLEDQRQRGDGHEDHQQHQLHQHQLSRKTPRVPREAQGPRWCGARCPVPVLAHALSVTCRIATHAPVGDRPGHVAEELEAYRCKYTNLSPRSCGARDLHHPFRRTPITHPTAAVTSLFRPFRRFTEK